MLARNKSNLVKKMEQQILFLGILLTIIYMIWLAISSVSQPRFFQVIIALTATHILFGRAAGISFGYAMELGHMVVIPTAMVIETIMVLLIYPLIILSIKNLLQLKKLDTFINNMTKYAKQHEKFIKRYGPLGLFAFVLFPFWMTGPLIGSIIGYFLGFSHIKNLSIVIVSTCFAVTGWGFLLKELQSKAALFNPYAPLLLVFLIIGAIILFHYLRRNSRKTNPDIS